MRHVDSMRSQKGIIQRFVVFSKSLPDLHLPFTYFQVPSFSIYLEWLFFSGFDQLIEAYSELLRNRKKLQYLVPKVDWKRHGAAGSLSFRNTNMIKYVIILYYLPIGRIRKNHRPVCWSCSVAKVFKPSTQHFFWHSENA